MKKLSSVLLAMALLLTCIPLGAIPVFATEGEEEVVSYSESTFNGHSYMIIEEYMSWTSAKAYCEQLGGHLATVSSQEEQDYLIELSKSTSKKCLWIGMKNKYTDKVYYPAKWDWVTGEEQPYWNWAYCGEIQHLDQYYVMMFTAGAFEGLAGQWQVNTNGGGRWDDGANGYDNYSRSDYGFICEWDEPYKVEEQKIKDLINDINLGPYALKGAYVEVLGLRFPLVNIEATINLILGDHLKLETSEDGTIKVLAGFDLNSSANISGSETSPTYWSDSYREVKQMYQQVTGDKVDTTRLWNEFSSLRGKLKKLEATMLVDVNASLCGYMEFKPQDGNYSFSQGGIIVSFEAATELRHSYGPAFVFLGISAGADGHLYFTNENNELNPEITVNPNFTLSGGLGVELFGQYAKGSIYGKLSAVISTKSSTPLSAGLELGIRGQVHLLNLINEDLNKTFASAQLYPNVGGPWPITYRLLSPSTDVTTKNGYESFINSGVPLSRDYLQTSYSLRRNAEYDGASFVKDNTYAFNSPQLVSFNDGTMLLVWIDDTGEKTISNVGSMMYSFYDGATWSNPLTVFENGTFNDTPVVCSDGTNAFIVWQKANKVFDENTSMSEKLPCFDLHFTSFDSATQTFADEICLTPEEDTTFEVYPQIEVFDNIVTVAWLENSDNNIYQTSGTNTIKTICIDSEFNVSDKTEVISSEHPISDIGLGNSAVYYLLRIDEEKSLYCYANGQTNLVQTDIVSFKCLNGSIFYANNTGFYEYDGQNTKTYASVGGMQNFTIVGNGEEYALFTEQVNEDFSTTLYYNKKPINSDEWAGFEVYANRNKTISDYVPVMLANGDIYVAVNYTNYETGSSILVVERCTEDVDTVFTYVVYDDAQLKNGSVDLVLGVKNNSSTEISEFSLQVLDDADNVVDAQTIYGVLPAFGSTELNAWLNIPEDADKRRYSFVLLPLGYEELNENNNVRQTTFECIHLPSEEFVIETEETPTASAVMYQVCEYCDVRIYYYACGENLTHTYDNICDSECNECGDVRDVQGHTYDNACDAICNNCGKERVPSEHIYDAVCDEYCKECGFRREAEFHDYNNGDSFVCLNCGMTETSLLSVSNFEDAQLHNLNIGQETTIDEDAARTGAFGLYLRGDGGWSGLANHYVDTVVGRKYELSFWVKVNNHHGANLQIRDSINGTKIASGYYGENYSSWTQVKLTFIATSTQTQIVFSGSGAGEPEDVYLDDICLTTPVLWSGLTSVSEDVNGLAFKFDVSAAGGQVVNNTEYVNDSALVVPGIDGQEYKLLRMGAVVSNKSDVILDLENVDGKKTINIEAVYLCDLGEMSLSYAVRVINIPVNGMSTDIYARPYYVYEQDGEEIVAYGNVAVKSYNQAYTYNGDFETGDISGWSCNSGTATIVTDSHSGKYALQLANPSAWGNAATRTFDVKPNTQYEVSWYAKRVSGTGAFNLLVTQAESPYTAFTKIAGQNWMTETSGDWVKYSCVYSTGENTQMRLQFTTETASPGTIIIDDVVVSKWYPAATSSFEDGSTDGWTNDNNALSVVSEDGSSGNYCLAFDTTCGDYIYARKKIFIDANADYKITFKMKSNLNYPVIVRLLSSSWETICTVKVTPTTDWEEYTVVLNPGEYFDVLLALQANLSASAGQVFWFDDISYEPV